MRRIAILCTIIFFCAINCMAQEVAKPRTSHIRRGVGPRDNYDEFHLPGSVNRAAGFVVYGDDTLRGIISFTKFDVFIEQPIDAIYSYYYHFKPRNLRLKSVVVYNIDNKPLCLVRVKRSSHRLLRLVHEGKLSIYDDRFAYIYHPGQIDKNLIVVSYNGHVKELGSFFAASTKRNLIGYVNNAYSLNLRPKNISWKDLLLTVDNLE